jgi:hypothetical protein
MWRAAAPPQSVPASRSLKFGMHNKLVPLANMRGQVQMPRNLLPQLALLGSAIGSARDQLN